MNTKSSVKKQGVASDVLETAMASSLKSAGVIGSKAATSQAKDHARVEVPAGDAPVLVGISPEQMTTILRTCLDAAKEISVVTAQNATVAIMYEARADLDKASKEFAEKAVQEAMARKAKAGLLKTYGASVATSAIVFAAGTLGIVGYNRYFGGDNRNNNRQAYERLQERQVEQLT